jgi:putative ABC transport system permease protein
MNALAWLCAVRNNMLHRSVVESDLDEELRLHIENRADDLQRTGLSRPEAERQARLEFGGTEKFKEESREQRGGFWLETFWSDLRFAVRMLRKSPGFTVVALLTLAFGIGANTAIFSYVNDWLIKPLPYPNADRLVVLLSHDTKQGWTSKNVPSTADFLDYQQQAASFEQLASWTSWDHNLTSDGPPDRIEGGLVSWNFFQALGVQPILGRTFLPRESEPGSNHVAILSQGLWQSRFSADPRIVGRTIKLQGETYSIVGVMPRTFLFPLMGTANIWTPMAFDEKAHAERQNSWFQAFGLLRPGVTREQASAELAAIATNLEKSYPESNKNRTSLLSPMAVEIGKNEGADQAMLHFWLVGLVLLIACANVANLMLARTTSRAKEFALRGALGASSAKIVRQLLTESLLLFSLGGAAGALFALWIIRWIEHSIPERIRGYLVNYGHIEFNATTFLYALVIALLCGVVFGLAPALQSSRLDFIGTLKESGAKISGNRRAAPVLRIFVAGEIALAVVVLISTALLVQSLAHMVYESLGFQPQNVIATQTTIPPNKYSSPSQVRSFWEQALDRIRVVPGVVSVGAGQYLPFSGSNETERVHVVGRPPAEPSEERSAQFSAVTPGYFTTMQIPLFRGRLLDTRDGPDAPNAAVINEALSREQFPNEDPIGKQIEIPLHHSVWTIVGIVRNVKQFTLSDAPDPQLYAAAAQFPTVYMSIVVRTTQPASQITSAIRDAIWSVDPEQPISRIRLLEDLIAEQNTLMRTTTQTVAFFGVLALLLGAIGIYGVMAYSVGQRVHEIGIRMALGASKITVLRMILSQGLKLTVMGIVFGLLGAFATTRALAAMLYKVHATDPLTFAFVALFFSGVALAACAIPARRAMNVDPVVALRHE